VKLSVKEQDVQKLKMLISVLVKLPCQELCFQFHQMFEVDPNGDWVFLLLFLARKPSCC